MKKIDYIAKGKIAKKRQYKGVRLPWWSEIERKVNGQIQLDTLEQFIYDYEPCRPKDNRLFRKNLKKLVTELFENERA